MCVWHGNAASAISPQIGNVMSTMGRVGNLVYIYGDGLNGNVNVNFNNIAAVVESVTANKIVTRASQNATAGYNNITITKNGTVSNTFVYNVLSEDQNRIIFHVTAATNVGENIYIVGNIPELDSWEPNNCTEAMMNPNYPEWFLPVSVPINTNIEFKFIKKDAQGNAILESGDNRVILSSSLPAGSIDSPIYNWK